nr:hypothetical protein HK105_007380 [Polyrhizophydium stewartii]
MLGVFSRLAPLLLLATSDFAAAARQNNKTANTISIGVLDIGMPTLSDQFAFGVRMATAQVNKNTSMLPDTTLTTQRVFVPQANVNPALLYDTVVTLCDSGQVIALASLTDGDTVKATSLVCPNLPHYSPIGGSAELSNKQLYPLFYRTTETIAQDLQVFVAHFKYFGWTRGAVITQSHWKFAAALSFEVFGSQGINLLASLNIADYDPTISQYYCPQIKSDFEFLRSTRLRIFVMFADQSNLIDYMMAANLTGLVGRNYAIPLDPSLLAAINVPWIVPEDSIDGTYYAYWNTLMVSYLNWVIANEAYLYPGMNLNQTDPTMPDYPLNYFYDDPGANYVPDWLLRGGYDAATSLAYTLEKLVTDLGTTGAALANSSLIPQVTLARVLEPYPRLPTAGGANKFVSNGDPYFARYGLYQLHGQSIAQLVYLAATYTLTSANGSGVFYVMPESYIWCGGWRVPLCVVWKRV